MDRLEDKVMNKLVFTSSLEYEPVREYTRSGSCQMKCPCGDCVLEIVLLNDLKGVIQNINIDVKTETQKDK